MRIEGSVSSIGRQAFLKMNWKCLLVGLVLVFPGTLVSVEGRYYSQENRAVSEQDGFLANLFNLFQQEQQRRLERYYGSRDDAVVAADKRPDNIDNNNNNNNVKQADNTVVQTPNKDTAAVENGADTAAAADPAVPIEEAAGKATSQGGKVKEEGINMAAQPQAMRQELSRHGASSSKVAASNTLFITVVTGCTVLAAVAIVGAGVCWYKYHKGAKAASVVDYPAYGVTGPTKDRVPSPGDRKLAHSAQMYHYQHQKQQMMALQSASSGEMKHDGSDDESVEDNDDADYTVYECPGLAPTGEMEVKNPLFRGDETPSTPANDDTRPAPTEY